MKREDVLALAAAAAVFFILTLGLGLQPVVPALIAFGAYFAFGLIFKKTKKIGGVDIEDIAGGEELDAALQNAQDDLKEIRRAAVASDSAAVRAGSQQLVRTGSNIIHYLEQHVDRAPSAQRFLDYYLDTAVDILDKYLNLEKSGAPEKKLAQVTQKTEQAIAELNSAFENSYTRLLQGDILDIEDDIGQLKKTMDTENFR